MIKYKDFIKEFFDGITVSKFKKEIHNYRNYIVTKNDDNVEWMSSNLTGVHNIRFSNDDVNRFFTIFNIDHNSMRNILRDKKEHVVGINPKFEVTTIPMNVSIVILTSLLINESISSKQKDEIIDDLFFIMSFRMITSIYSRDWAYLANEEDARKTFDVMTQQVDIKRLGYNLAVIEFKSKIFKEGTYYKRLKDSYKDVTSMTDVVVAVSGSIRAWHKYVTTLHYQIIDDEAKHSKRSVLDKDFEDSGLNDVTATTSMYYEKIVSITTHRNDLNDIKLMDTLISILPSAFNKDITLALDVINETGLKYPKKQNEILHMIIDNSIDILKNNNIINKYDERIVDIITILTKTYSNPSNRDDRSMFIKNYFHTLFMKEVGIRNVTRVRNDTFVLIVYLFILSLSVR